MYSAKAARLVARVDLIAGDFAGRQIDLGRQVGLLDFLGDDLRGHVGRADDLLLAEAVLDGVGAVRAHHDRRDAEGDQHDPRDDSAYLESFAHFDTSIARSMAVCGLRRSRFTRLSVPPPCRAANSPAENPYADARGDFRYPW